MVEYQIFEKRESNDDALRQELLIISTVDTRRSLVCWEAT